jgi:hypothetical protein
MSQLKFDRFIFFFTITTKKQFFLKAIFIFLNNSTRANSLNLFINLIFI